MKLVIALCVFTVIALSAGKPKSRGLICVEGRCFGECEEGTHAYTIGCDYLTPEASCDNPNPVADTRGHMCDYSACYCDSPTVRDSVSGKCVKLEECPPKTE